MWEDEEGEKPLLWAYLADGQQPFTCLAICWFGMHYWSVSKDISSVSNGTSYIPGKYGGRKLALPMILVTKCTREWCRYSQSYWTDSALLTCSTFWSNALCLQIHLKLTSKHIRITRAGHPFISSTMVCLQNVLGAMLGIGPDFHFRTERPLLTTGWQGQGQTSEYRRPGCGLQAFAVSTWKMCLDCYFICSASKGKPLCDLWDWRRDL